MQVRIDVAGLASLQVKCDGAFPMTCWVNFTDVDVLSPAFGASFCVAGEVESGWSTWIALSLIEQARDRKRAEFRANGIGAPVC